MAAQTDIFWITLLIIASPFLIGLILILLEMFGILQSRNSGHTQQPPPPRELPNTAVGIDEVIDVDAVEVLVALGYKPRDAKQRVLRVFKGGMGTQETIKKAMQSKI